MKQTGTNFSFTLWQSDWWLLWPKETGSFCFSLDIIFRPHVSFSYHKWLYSHHICFYLLAISILLCCYFHCLSSIQCLLIEEVFPQDVWPTGYKGLFICLSLVVHSSGTWWNLWHVTIYGGLLMQGTLTNHTTKSHWLWLKCLQGTWNSHRSP